MVSQSRSGRGRGEGFMTPTKGHNYKLKIAGHWRKVRVQEIIGRFAKVITEKDRKEFTCGIDQLKTI